MNEPTMPSHVVANAPAEKGMNPPGTSPFVAGAVLAAGAVLRILSGQAFPGAVLEALAALMLAGPIMVDAWQGLRRGRTGFAVLVALACAACLARGDYLTAGLVAFFMTLAGQLEKRTALGADRAIEALIRGTPAHVHVPDGAGGLAERPLAALRPGEAIRILPGEMVPADGVISAGESSLDESSITGESRPLDKSPGAPVFAGTINLTGVLDVRVERVGEDTTLGRVRRLIQSAAASKSPFLGVMENNAGWATPLVLLVALLAYHFHGGGPGALDLAVAILVMACPCSLVLAAPSAMIAAVTAAARAGILVRNAVELENFHRVDHIFFDKTGTLTTGQLALTGITAHAGLEKGDLLELAGGLALNSSHPAARGINAARRDQGLPAAGFNGVVEEHGRGLRGRLDGENFLLGRCDWVASELGFAPQDEPQAVGTRLVLGSDRRGRLGEFILEDHLRPDAAASLARLRELGVQKLSLLTGDAWEPARRVASAVGFDQVHARCLPQDKLARLSEARRAGDHTAVIGDGINDAPILAAGDVGIAMGALGSQVAIESASVALMTPNLDRLPFLFDLSRRAKRVIWANIVIGLVVILGGLLFFIFNHGNPVAAAVLQNVGALAILFNSARLVRPGPGEGAEQTDG